MLCERLQEQLRGSLIVAGSVFNIDVGRLRTQDPRLEHQQVGSYENL